MFMMYIDVNIKNIVTTYVYIYTYIIAFKKIKFTVFTSYIRACIYL